MECIKINIQNTEIKNIIQNIISNTINETEESEEKRREEEIKFYDTILEIIDTGFTSDEYNTSTLDSGQDEIIQTEKITLTFTTTQNQKNNINKNITTLDLGECEKILKRYYNISNDEILYMKKMEIIQEGMQIPKIEYDVYYKLYGTNLIKLNLSFCKDSKVSLFIPLTINENIDKLNSSSGYYNDICYLATSDGGTDIILKDRKKEYIEGNKSVCQDDCDFSDYDYNKQKANCSCKVKESSSSFKDMNINKEKLYENFVNIKNIANLNILICYRNLFNKKGIIYNFGFYIILLVIVFHMTLIFIFYLKDINVIRNIIMDISFGIDNYELLEKKGKFKKKIKLFVINNKKESEIEKKDEPIINDINNIDNEKK